MAEVVPVDQFLEWYPGWKPEHIDNPWLRLKSGPFTKADEDRFWFVDFHWPRGFSPLGFSFVTDAAWSTQLAAHQLPLPPAGGLVQRMGGPFLYEGEVPVTSEWEIGYRAARIGKNMPRFLQNFDAIWDERKWELELGLGYFEGYDFAGKSLAELGQFMRDARTFQSRAWEIHFEIMYPLLAIYLQLYGVCAENGIDPGSIAKMLQGRDSKIMETDRAMWDLADEAKRLDITAHFEHEPDDDPRRAHRRRRQRLDLADQVRRLPGALRLAHRGHRRHQHPVVEREPGVAARTDPQLRRHGRSPRLRQVPRILAPRARRGDRRRPLEAVRRRARRVQRVAGDQHRRQLRVVERGPQLLHRPARFDPDAARRAGHRRGRRGRHLRRLAVPVLPRARRGLCRAPSSGRTCSRSPPPGTSTTTTTRSCVRRSPRSSARCPTRSRIPS